MAEEPPAAPGSGPAIAPTTAPGIAFNYRYAFRLPGQKIASVQEQHAQACEKLGLSRCRIAGMRYRLVNERDIEAMLAFKLDPAIARQFGKAGIETVANNEGMLIDSEISGDDAGAAIAAANRSEAQLSDDLERIEAQLARAGLAAAERDRLQAEAQQLRQTIRANRDARDEQRESLATTPMVFQYGSGDLVPGFDTHSPMRQALEAAGDNLIGGAAFLFVALATLLPWGVLLLLLWWLVRRLAPKFGSRRAAGPEPQAGGSVES
ncbi:hypothetical protein SH591_05535 [Sphingomonas sp. LY54]|uniref:hypothetical protein n=1 Tax=Sphingomonas sp. LY54 TaxID=3095343 RepID=UPI002D77D18E|nr:hypothetical protein [Sphingomonas sp. LY54]WRP29640.1 hypothetical protein SH591_05535 [Sphingomonas sp. LY54]